MIDMAKVLIDVVDGKEVWIDVELEGMYLRFKRFFNEMTFVVEPSTMIESLVAFMTNNDLLTTSSALTFELVHNLYVKNLLTLYEVSGWHEQFLKVDVLDEVEKLLEGITKKYIQFEVFDTKVDKRFYRLVNILLAEANDFELEEAFFDHIEINNVLDHANFIKYAISYNMFTRLEYVEKKSLALHEVLLEVLTELTRLFEKSLSKDYDTLKELIGYADDIANTVYDEVYRS